MATSPPQDPGFVRWYVFIPGHGRRAVPAGVVDREAYALKAGATRLEHGSELVWVRPAATSGRHLAVVR